MSTSKKHTAETWSKSHPSRRCFLKAGMVGAGTLGLSGIVEQAAFTAEGTGHRELEKSLFIMDTWFWDNQLDTAQQIKILKKFNHLKGCDSRNRWDEFPRVLQSFDQAGIELTAVYVGIQMDEESVPAFVPELIRQLQGRKTLMWINLKSKKFKPSDAAGDPCAIGFLRKIADAAADAGIQISLYPHARNWSERTSDVYRVAKKTNRDNVGCTFNLYHWLFVEGPDNLEAKAKAVLPKLNCITINGSMKNASQLDVRKAILPLGEGDYDVENFVRTFVKLGFKGPIGYQGYGIGGDIQTKLQNSLDVWSRYCRNITR